MHTYSCAHRLTLSCPYLYTLHTFTRDTPAHIFAHMHACTYMHTYVHKWPSPIHTGTHSHIHMPTYNHPHTLAHVCSQAHKLTSSHMHTCTLSHCHTDRPDWAKLGKVPHAEEWASQPFLVVPASPSLCVARGSNSTLGQYRNTIGRSRNGHLRQPDASLG